MMRNTFKGWKPGISAALAGVLLYMPSALAFYGHSNENNHIVIDLSGMPIVNNTLNGDNYGGGGTSSLPASKDNNLGYQTSFTAGFIAWSHLLIGATYDNSYLSNLASSQTSATPGQTYAYRTEEWGPTLGLIFGGFYFEGTYFLSGSKKTSATNTSSTDGAYTLNQGFNNTGLSGYLLAIGYNFEVVRHIYIGPKLAYRNVSYSTQSMTDYMAGSTDSYTSQKLATKDQDSELDPMLSLQFRF